jgi:VWFA-related protein
MRAILAVALTIGVSTQAASAADPRSISTDAVVADAQGRAVSDLKPTEFEVFENGRPLTLESVRVVTAGGSAEPGEMPRPILSRADEASEAARPGTRLFAIFLDEYHIEAGADSARVRDLVERFVDALGPRDLLVVIRPLDSLLNLRLTRDFESARRTIAAFEGRKGSFEARNTFEKNFIGGDPARIEAARAQIVTSALNAVAIHLGSLGASRKTLMLVSEGFARPPGSRRGDESLPTLERVMTSASRSSVSIYPIDPHASASAPDANGSVTTAAREALLALAEQTGGRASLDPAAVDEGLRRIVADATTYYLITFRTDTESDGRLHPIEVRVKRPGVQLRARTAYWSGLPADRAVPSLALANAQFKFEDLQRRISPLIQPWFGLARGADGKTRVSFVWEPARQIPGSRTPALAPARITLKASRPDGTPVFEGVVAPTGPLTSETSAAGPREAVFETLPARLRVQMSIEDANARVVDTDIRDITAGALTGPVALGTAEFFRAASARAYRVLAADAAAPPVAAREFSRSERLLIRVPVYSAGTAAALSARLVSKAGSLMRELSVTVGPESDLQQIDLSLAGLATGDYLVELLAKSDAGQATDSVSFRVTQ